MARLGIRRSAGTSAGNTQISHAHHQRLAVDIREATAQIPCESSVRVPQCRPVQCDMIDRLCQSFKQPITKVRETSRFGFHFLEAEPHGCRKSDDSRHIQCPASSPTFLSASVDLRRQSHLRSAPADWEHAVQVRRDLAAVRAQLVRGR